jgi:hypothetical protein
MMPEMQPLRHNFAAMRTCIEDIRLQFNPLANQLIWFLLCDR